MHVNGNVTPQLEQQSGLKVSRPAEQSVCVEINQEGCSSGLISLSPQNLTRGVRHLLDPQGLGSSQVLCADFAAGKYRCFSITHGRLPWKV